LWWEGLTRAPPVSFHLVSDSPDGQLALVRDTMEAQGLNSGVLHR